MQEDKGVTVSDKLPAGTPVVVLSRLEVVLGIVFNGVVQVAVRAAEMAQSRRPEERAMAETIQQHMVEELGRLHDRLSNLPNDPEMPAGADK